MSGSRTIGFGDIEDHSFLNLDRLSFHKRTVIAVRVCVGNSVLDGVIGLVIRECKLDNLAVGDSCSGDFFLAAVDDNSCGFVVPRGVAWMIVAHFSNPIK